MNIDAAVPKPNGLIPGVGAIVSAIETAANCSAVAIGKPEQRLFEYAIKSLGTDTVAMIGDNQSVDVRGASEAGIDSILVTKHAEQTIEGPKPDAIISDLRDLFRTTH